MRRGLGLAVGARGEERRLSVEAERIRRPLAVLLSLGYLLAAILLVRLAYDLGRLDGFLLLLHGSVIGSFGPEV